VSTAIQLNEKGIDNATEAIDKILRTAADFGLKKKRPKDKFRQQNKNWFDFENLKQTYITLGSISFQIQ
jgi:hypothetical protein